MQKKILVVDDAMFMRMVIRKNLEEIGYNEILEAKDGEEAIRMYAELTPDLVMLDITMPGMSGLEALEGIKAVDSDAKVIMCSAVGQEFMIQKAMEKGAADFIVKPFDKNSFEKTVKMHLNNVCD